jgi:hypothetical protein
MNDRDDPELTGLLLLLDLCWIHLSSGRITGASWT